MKTSVLQVLALPVLLAALGCSGNGASGANRASEPALPGSGAKPTSSDGSTGKVKRGYERGQVVSIAGVASDFANQPLDELEVVLEASRHSFDYLRFRKRRPVVRKATATTSTDGSFEIQWPWDPGFNRFALLFGVTVAVPGGETFRVLHREDLSRRIEHGSPVVASVQIDDTLFLESFREFQDSLESEAQHKVYREAGKPDKVREKATAESTDVDWWYFELGKVFRFRDGELREVENFEPVKPLDP